MGRFTAAALIAIVVVTSLFGALLDPKPFAENLLAETAGAAASIFVGLTLVEKLIARQRAREWERVSVQTRNAIYAHLMDIGFDFAMLLPSRQDDRMEFVNAFSEFDHPSIDAARAIDSVADYVEEHKEELAKIGDVDDIVVVEPGQDIVEVATGHPNGAVLVASQDEARKVHDRIHRSNLDSASSRMIYQATRSHIQQLRDVLTPRVLQFQSNPALAERVIDIESAEREWLSHLDMIEGWGAPEQYGWESAAKLLHASAKVIQQLTVMAADERLACG